jgi:hypothetical protein
MRHDVDYRKCVMTALYRRINTSLYWYEGLLLVLLCSINRHKAVWFGLVLAFSSSKAASCVVSWQAGEYIHFEMNQNKVLSDSCFSRFCGKWQDREKHKRPLWKYAKGTFLNVMIIYRNKTRKRMDQLSVNWDLFIKLANAVERKMPGRHSSDKTVPRLRERNSISKIPPTAKKSRPQKQCVVC